MESRHDPLRRRPRVFDARIAGRRAPRAAPDNVAFIIADPEADTGAIRAPVACDPDLRPNNADIDIQTGSRDVEKSGHWIHPSQIFFSKTTASPAPETAHTDARIDAKLSHVQHSSTDKHGPSRDQAGTRRCVPHVAPRPEPRPSPFFFPGTSRDIFPPRCDPQRASRPAFPRIASPTDIRERHVRVVSRRSFRASRLGRPMPTLPAGSTLVDPSSKFCQLTLRFFGFFFFFARAKRCALRHSVSISSRRLWRLAGLGRARHSRRRRRTPRALASLLRQPLQRQPPQLDRRARPSRSIDLPQPRRRRGAIQGLDDPPLR